MVRERVGLPGSVLRLVGLWQGVSAWVELEAWVDATLGLCIWLPFMAVSSIPLLPNWLHHMCLHNTTQGGVAMAYRDLESTTAALRKSTMGRSTMRMGLGPRADSAGQPGESTPLKAP
mmetsp:Transcript_30643/g.79578  ORF Transcript_30643/g.79578 Transcript_30643/m.79578 type:complete len:118 (+) Transcript_30643:367-720(+)